MKNIDIIKAALDSAELVYEQLDESVIRLRIDNSILLIGDYEENSTIHVGGYTSINLPKEKWTDAYELLNSMNLELPAQCYLDSDGDLRSSHVVDVDDLVVSEKMVMSALLRVVSTLKSGYDRLIRLRFS